MDRRKQVEQWLALRDRQGLTYRELSQCCGLQPSTLAHWAWRLKREPRARDGCPEFVEVVPSESPSLGSADGSATRVEIEICPGRRVIVDARIAPEHLDRILSAVARC